MKKRRKTLICMNLTENLDITGTHLPTSGGTPDQGQDQRKAQHQNQASTKTQMIEPVR